MSEQTTALEPLELEWTAVNNALDLILEEFGRDHVFDPGTVGVCTYFDLETGTPKCLVGQVFDKLGITLDALLERYHAGTVTTDDPDLRRRRANQRGISRFFDKTRRVFNVEERTMRLLKTAQVVQDDRGTWGKAVDKGREAAYEYMSREGGGLND